MLAPELKHRVRKLWDKFWAGGIANPLPAIEQITYLIFMKRLEVLDKQRQEGERICDPAFGTSGFLVNSYQHVLKMHTTRDSLVFDADGTPHNLDGDLLGDRKRFLTGRNFVGYDFDRTMVRLGLMNRVLHGIDDPHGCYAETLSQRFTEARQYDVVMTNPPFTGSIDKADKSDRFALDTNKTELLFVKLLLGGGAQQASVGALPVVGNCR